MPVASSKDMRSPHLSEVNLMQPVITFRGLDHSDALEADIRKRIDTLNRYYQPIMGCRVLVELAQGRHQRGNRFHVAIDLTVPGDELLVAHEASLHATEKDNEAEKPAPRAEPRPQRKHAQVAVREAFSVARRKLQDYGRRQRGSVKAHPRTPAVVRERR
jgi:ribosome-associated translation inhibitor RaiA